MKITLNWLKQYVDFGGSPEQLAERLTMLGLEVEGVHKVAGEFEGIVVGQVLSRDKVQGSDKLSVCRVADGKGERQVICGAQNHQAGDKIPLILPGASLPLKPGEKEPFTIKVRKVMGVESHGMLCSPQELGLPDPIEGILILPPDAKVGQPFAEFLGKTAGDVVYDLEVTPNRPDWNSVIGNAREISADSGQPLRLPEIKFAAAQLGPEPASKFAAVRLDDAEACPRYVARIIIGVKIGPSPDWLRSMLEKIGLRGINNVVDVTNYVMFECGQPLHAFDYRYLTGLNGQPPTIVVRHAAEGEKFVTLDGVERTLTASMLLIADETRALALAGVMGGQNSEIRPDTTDVLLESANFKSQGIRATSKKLDLRTDSSYRFERGTDLGGCDWASRRAAQLILETAGGTLVEEAIDAYPQPAKSREIRLRHDKAAALLGVPAPVASNVNFLRRLGLEVSEETAESCLVKVPTFRLDLKREVDLIEEIGRLHGVDKIPSTGPRGALGANAFDAVHDQTTEARRILCGLGLFEAQGQTLISREAAKQVPGLTPEQIIPLERPLSSDMDVLRPSLLPVIIDSLRNNVRHKNTSIALFEIGRVFWLEEGKAKEERRLALGLTGELNPIFWSGEERGAKFDIYDLKGALEEFFEHFGLRGISLARNETPHPFFIESATVNLGRLPLGFVGQLSPLIARKHDLRDAVLLAELRFDELLARRNPSKGFKPLPAFPAIRRDLAMLLPETAAHESILHLVKRSKTANLESMELFDVFRGKNIPAGQKSVAYAFTYRNPEKTLTDTEVNTAHDKLVNLFKQELKAVARES